MLVDFLKRLQPLKELPLWLRYLLTASIVLACFALRIVLGWLVGSEAVPIFLFFVPAVVLAPTLFDKGSGYLAVGLSAALSIYFFTDPVGSFRLTNSGHAWGLLAFVLIGLMAAAFIEALRETVEALNVRTAELSHRTSELEAAQGDLRKLASQRQLLLSDINHRIKNHLATVAAGISLSRKQVKNAEAAEALDAAVRRLQVLGRTYSKLHADGPEVSLDAKDFLESLCSDLRESLIGLRPISFKTSIEHAQLNAQRAVTLGLIVNELVANAVKYAFPGDQPGEIQVAFSASADHEVLEVRDNGVGREISLEAAGTGTKLVEALAAQIGARTEWCNTSGTRVTVRFGATAEADAGG